MTSFGRVVFFLAACAYGSASAADLAGAKDHPLASRFKGSQIVGFAHADFSKVVFPAGKDPQTGTVRVREVSGQVTSIAYDVPPGAQTVEVFESYRQALKAAGFQIVYACHAGRDGEQGACGGYSFATAYGDPVVKRMRGDQSHIINALDSTDGDVSYLMATIDHAGSKASVGVYVGQDEREKNAEVLLQVVEEAAMQSGQVTVDAAAIGKGLASEGKIALYGLHFASDSDQLQADSRSTLDEMAKALKTDPSMRVYIVGHTDNSGALAHNLVLSQKRAEAVVKALTIHYAIAPARLAAKGLASYAPVAANGSETGKAKNRRVEMVVQ